MSSGFTNVQFGYIYIYIQRSKISAECKTNFGKSNISFLSTNVFFCDVDVAVIVMLSLIIHLFFKCVTDFWTSVL